MNMKNYFLRKQLLISTLLVLLFLNNMLAQQPFSWVSTVQEVPQHASAPSLAEDVTIGPDGNTITVGYSYGNFDFDPGPLQAISYGDNSANLYIQKLNDEGGYIWHKYFGNQGVVLGESITVDNNNNSYVIGTFSGTLLFDNISITSNGGQDSFVLKLDKDGNVLWARNFGLSGHDEGNSIFYNKSTNELYFSGNYETTQTTSNVTKDVYVIKLNPTTGVDIWLQTFGSYQQENSYEITGDKNGNVYVTGTYFKKLDLKAFPSTTTMSNLLTAPLNNRLNTFVLKLRSSGQVIWAKSISVIGDTYGGVKANSITVDNNENIYLVGDYNGVIDFDPGNLQYLINNQGARDVFILSLKSTGDLKWFKRINGLNNGNAYDRGLAIDLDNQGGVITGGISVNGGLFVARYADANGNLDWIHKGGDFGVVNSLVVGTCDQIYSVGVIHPGTLSTNFTIDLDPSSNLITPNVIGHSNAFNLAWKWNIQNFDPAFTYEVCVSTLKVSGVNQPLGTNPNSDWHLIEYFPGSTTEIRRAGIAWWQQSVPYNYNTNAITFNYQLQPGSFYYIKHGMYMNNSCAAWQEERKYGIQANSIPWFKKKKKQTIVKSRKFLEVGNEDVKLYPNPVSEILNIESISQEITSYQIFDLTGRNIVSNKYNREPINVSALSPGNYVMQITTLNSIYTKKIIKE